MGDAPKDLETKKHNILDILDPIIKMSSVFAIAFAVFQFNETQQLEREKIREANNFERQIKVFDAFKNTYDRRQNALFELNDVIGSILAYKQNSPEWTKSYIRYSEIYWGIFTTTSSKLEESMKIFMDNLDNCKSQKQENECQSKLRISGRDLEIVVRNELGSMKSVIEEKYFSSK